MIRITIEVVPLGMEKLARVIARGTITNDGTGSQKSGNYRFDLSKEDFPEESGTTGRVVRFPRVKLRAWDLVLAALLNAFGSRLDRYNDGRVRAGGTLVPLERVKRSKRLREWLEPRRVHIWSKEHRAWWGANGSGHFIDRDGAGIYSGADAIGRTHHCGPEKGICFEVIR